MQNPYEIGKRVYLRAPSVEDAQGRWHEWISDPETSKFLVAQNFPNNAAIQAEFVKTRVDTPGNLILAIIDKETDKHIGIASLNSINWVYKFADIAVLIGEKDYIKKGGYGLEAVSLLLRAGFQRLNLENIKGAYVSSNAETEHILKLFRFDEVGRIPALYDFDGEKQDCVIVNLPRAKWLARNKLEDAA